MSSIATGRRAEYARLTREAIITAARELFAEQGYFATTVNHIAVRARVAPATVYAVGGGKQGLIATLVERWSTAPIIAERGARIAKAGDGREVLRLAAEAVRDMRIEYADIMYTVRSVAPHDEAVAEALSVGTARYRSAINEVAERLGALGVLGAGIDVRLAGELLWFYFGFTGFATLVEENGWSYDRAAEWLADQAARALGIPDHAP